MAKCLVCSPRRCATKYFLYVVEDVEKGLTKIGMTKHLSKRMGMYRKQVNTQNVVLRYDEPAGCNFVAMHKEERAHRRIARNFKRVRGDWFAAPAEASIAALSPTQRKKAG